MQSAQRHALDEVRAQQLLTSPTPCPRSLPGDTAQRLRRVGSTAHDLAVAFRHQSSGPGSDTRVIRTPGRRAPDALITVPRGAACRARSKPGGHDCRIRPARRRHDQQPPPATGEWAARHDRLLEAALGLPPDRASALVALLAGSRGPKARTGSIARTKPEPRTWIMNESDSGTPHTSTRGSWRQLGHDSRVVGRLMAPTNRPSRVQAVKQLGLLSFRAADGFRCREPFGVRDRDAGTRPELVDGRGCGVGR
jgi:hypothetical protein